MLDNLINKSIAYSFEHGVDFESYLTDMKTINSYVAATFKIELDKKNDITIMRFMFELTELSIKLNSKIRLYNKKYPKKSVLSRESIKFEGLSDLTTVFKGEVF